MLDRRLERLVEKKSAQHFLEGVVVENRRSIFRVRLNHDGRDIIAYPAAKLRNKIRIVTGDTGSSSTIVALISGMPCESSTVTRWPGVIQTGGCILLGDVVHRCVCLALQAARWSEGNE